MRLAGWLGSRPSTGSLRVLHVLRVFKVVLECNVRSSQTAGVCLCCTLSTPGMHAWSGSCAAAGRRHLVWRTSASTLPHPSLPPCRSPAGEDVVPTFTTSNERILLLLAPGASGMLRLEDAERLQVGGWAGGRVGCA